VKCTAILPKRGCHILANLGQSGFLGGLFGRFLLAVENSITAWTAQTGQKQGRRFCLTLFRLFPAPHNGGKKLSSGCPDLASLVQIWPTVSIFGQFWPVLANLVQNPPNGGIPDPLFREYLGNQSQENPYPFRQN
jgi:hypothetical protein